jgi:DNA-binding XRE family transcriptional regulator
MGTSLQEKLALLAPERQQRIQAETDRLQAEYLPLRDLRQARQLTQVRLAEILGKSQVTIAQMERRTDILLSTLRSAIEAMGGQLEIVVRFPDRVPVVLQGLSAEVAPLHPLPHKTHMARGEPMTPRKQERKAAKKPARKPMLAGTHRE